jgi:hypothetical protein
VNIYQYTDPRARGDDTRWIAAKNQEEADDYAKSKGWRACGGRIFGKGYDVSVAEFGRMGCDVVLRYRNHYVCSHCATSWTDTWSATCNDRCPACNVETEPTHSEDITQ